LLYNQRRWWWKAEIGYNVDKGSLPSTSGRVGGSDIDGKIRKCGKGRLQQQKTI